MKLIISDGGIIDYTEMKLKGKYKVVSFSYKGDNYGFVVGRLCYKYNDYAIRVKHKDGLSDQYHFRHEYIIECTVEEI